MSRIEAYSRHEASVRDSPDSTQMSVVYLPRDQPPRRISWRGCRQTVRLDSLMTRIAFVSNSKVEIIAKRASLEMSLINRQMDILSKNTWYGRLSIKEDGEQRSERRMYRARATRTNRAMKYASAVSSGVMVDPVGLRLGIVITVRRSTRNGCTKRVGTSAQIWIISIPMYGTWSITIFL